MATTDRRRGEADAPQQPSRQPVDHRTAGSIAPHGLDGVHVDLRTDRRFGDRCVVLATFVRALMGRVRSRARPWRSTRENQPRASEGATSRLKLCRLYSCRRRCRSQRTRIRYSTFSSGSAKELLISGRFTSAVQYGILESRAFFLTQSFEAFRSPSYSYITGSMFAHHEA